MSLLPKGIVKASAVNPKTMVIFSSPKVGKTQLCSALPNSLLIDIEGGSDYVDAQKINVLDIARKSGQDPLSVLYNVINEIQEANRAKNAYVYDIGIIDTATALEDLVLPIANQKYRDTPQGKNWQGNDVTMLPQGAGYRFLREAFAMVINMLKACFNNFIILGHLKEKMMGAEGEEMSVKALDLTGKIGTILCSQVDAIGYMYRDEDGDSTINFQPSEAIVSGSRSPHLQNKKIKVITKNPDNSLNVSWKEIFID